MANNNGQITKIAWNFNFINNNLTEIFIYDAIADKQSVNWWTGEKGTEITPKLFAEEMNGVETPEICIRINSGGGDVFAAEAIRTQIREKRAEGKKITCKIDGLCASAAVGIAAACETITIPSSAYFMIHDPACFAYGYFSSGEFEKGKIMLDKVKQGIINAYSQKTGKDKQEISGLMTAETWYTGDEAVANGFCDELMFDDGDEEHIPSPADSGVLNFNMYRNCPAALLNSGKPAPADEYIQNKNKNKNKKGVNEQMQTEIKTIKTIDELTAAYPELTAQIAETAASVERRRIQDIEEIALPGFEGIINKAKFETPVTADNAAKQIVAAQKKQGAVYLSNIADDTKNSGINGVIADGQEGVDDITDPYGAAIDKVLPANNANK